MQVIQNKDFFRNWFQSPIAAQQLCWQQQNVLRLSKLFIFLFPLTIMDVKTPLCYNLNAEFLMGNSTKMALKNFSYAETNLLQNSKWKQESNAYAAFNSQAPVTPELATRDVFKLSRLSFSRIFWNSSF